MLKNETTTQSNSSEIFFCKPFENLQRYPMSEDMSHLMIHLLFSEKEFKLPEPEKPFLFKVIEKRIEHCFTFSINDQRLILFLCALSGTPGTAIMYLTYLQYWCKNHNIKNLTLNIFCERIFPSGFPKKEDLSILWDQVKVERQYGSDNLLDYSQASASIQF